MMKTTKRMRIVFLCLAVIVCLVMASCNIQPTVPETDPSESEEKVVPQEKTWLYPPLEAYEHEFETVCQEVGLDEVLFFYDAQINEEGLGERDEIYTSWYMARFCAMNISAYGVDYLEGHEREIRSIYVLTDLEQSMTPDLLKAGAFEADLRKTLVPIVSFINLMGESYTVADLMEKWKTEIDVDQLCSALGDEDFWFEWELNGCSLQMRISSSYLKMYSSTPNITDGLSVSLTDAESIELPPDPTEPTETAIRRKGTKLTGRVNNASDIAYYGFDIAVSDDEYPFQTYIRHIDVGVIQPGETKEWSVLVPLTGSQFDLEVVDGYPEQ